jgi:hypothetical protein
MMNSVPQWFWGKIGKLKFWASGWLYAGVLRRVLPGVPGGA